MNTVTSADSSYYAANTNEKTEKGPCLAMTPYGVIGAERVKMVFCLTLCCSVHSSSLVFQIQSSRKKSLPPLSMFLCGYHCSNQFLESDLYSTGQTS